MEKKLQDELSFHAKAEKQLNAKDQALTSTEKHRDKLLQELEDEKRRRQELQASLLMAKEASQLEVSEVARKMAKEKEEALQAQMDQLTKERSDLHDKLKREILALESEKKSANERLALIQQKQADAMRKFKEEHDKVAKVEAEKAELLIRIEHDETACKDLKQQIQELKKVLDNTKEHQEMDLAKIKKEKKELENQLNSVSATLGETQNSLKRLLDEEKMAHKRDIEVAREREQDLKKKLEEELEFHRLANTQLSDQDKVLKKTEEDRDKFLNDLEDEQKLRRELQAALLMAQEAIKTESTAAAKNAAEEKEKELQLAINDLNQQRKELKIRLTIEIEKLEKEKRSSNENLAKTQKDQQNLLLKFRQEHDKVEKMEAEKKELQDELNDNKSLCKDLEDQIADLKIKLNNKTSASEKDHKRNQKAMEDMEKALETANANLRTTEGKFPNFWRPRKMLIKKIWKRLKNIEQK